MNWLGHWYTLLMTYAFVWLIASKGYEANKVKCSSCGRKWFFRSKYVPDESKTCCLDCWLKESEKAGT